LLDTLITSRTRVKLLMKFFLNSRTTSYLRDLESEFGESTNAIRVELNRLEKAGLLDTEVAGNKKMYRANRRHPLFSDIHNLLLKHTGIDHIIEKVVTGMGGLQSAYVIGNFARGRDNPVIDLLLVGEGIDKEYLLHLLDKAEKFISRKIRYMIVGQDEATEFLKIYPEALLLWKEGEE
jgi:DNA-binding transcriptional ArsR family regulator